MMHLRPNACGQRIDHQSGIAEVARFIGHDGAKVFSVSHLPIQSTRPRRALLLCPSLCVDFIKNYRREVELARGLAARGIAVHRFHYRGTGNSDGDPSSITFESMCADAAMAIGYLMGNDVQRIAFMGTRWGALVAANAATPVPDAPIAFWDPVFAADSYFREGYRASLMSTLAGSKHGTRAATSYQAELERHGSIEVSGYRIWKRLIDSSYELDLSTFLSDPSHPLLLVQFGVRGQASRSHQSAVDQWLQMGFQVTLNIVSGARNTWFLDDQEPAALLSDEIKSTVAWVDKTLLAV